MIAPGGFSRTVWHGKRSALRRALGVIHLWAHICGVGWWTRREPEPQHETRCRAARHQTDDAVAPASAHHICVARSSQLEALLWRAASPTALPTRCCASASAAARPRIAAACGVASPRWACPVGQSAPVAPPLGRLAATGRPRPLSEPGSAAVRWRLRRPPARPRGGRATSCGEASWGPWSGAPALGSSELQHRSPGAVSWPTPSVALASPAGARRGGGGQAPADQPDMSGGRQHMEAG